MHTMYKSLLVSIPTERAPRPVIDGAISLAAHYQARLDAVAVGYETANIPLVAEGGAAVAAIFDDERERALERAHDIALRSGMPRPTPQGRG